MKTLKTLSTIILLSIFTLQLNAQYYEKKKEKPSFADKLFFGGGLGLQFGTVTQVEVSPIIGYKVTERFHTGIGISYSYYNDKRFIPTLDYSTYGASVFTRFFIFEGLFAHAEIEALNVEVYTSLSPTIESYRKWIDSYLVGGGYFQKLGQRSGIYFLVLWNLNETEFTPYTNPVIRIGFAF
ncbi:MAG: hypothetical protein P1P88_00610 [Bacteroidales bacterium]|nr:hypothetical protein [Bacteroidales bacterium]